MMMEKKSLIKAAKELVEVLGLQDEKTEKPIVIKSTMSQKDLDKFFKQAIEMIDPETDKISKATQSVIDWYENPEEDEPDEEIEDIEEEDEDEEIEESDEDEEPEEEDEEEEESLEDQLKNAKKVVDLKELLKNPAFSKVRKSLADEKNPIKLKKAMRDVLAGGSVEKPKPGNAGGKEKKETKKVTGYHRVDSVCEVLKNDKPKTVKDWIKSAADLYAEKTGKDVNLSESKTVVGFISKALIHFDIEIPAK